MNTLQKKSPWEKIPAGKNPWENQNVIIYLKHTQMCQTDCKSEPKLYFRPLNRCFKKLLLIVITSGHSFLHTINMRSCHI